MNMVNRDCPIGIMDSGIGGMAFLNAARERLPFESYIYFADCEYAPYGNKSEAEILARVEYVSERLLERGCKAVVLACNTATNVGVAYLRNKYNAIFVGLEPAIKPAVERGFSKILVLCTLATARQEKFLRLLSGYDCDKITVSPQPSLAMDIEKNIGNKYIIKQAVNQALANHANTDAVVLGCTHYIFAREQIEEFYRSLGRSVEIFDGNDGALRRLQSLLEQSNLFSTRSAYGNVEYLSK